MKLVIIAISIMALLLLTACNAALSDSDPTLEQSEGAFNATVDHIDKDSDTSTNDRPSILMKSEGDYSTAANNTNEVSSTWEKNEHQYLLSNTMLSPSLSADEGMAIELSEIGLKDVIVRKKYERRVSDLHSYPLYVYIICDYRFNNATCHDSYIAVEVGSKILFYDFGGYSYDEFLYLCDVDRDGSDEIIVQQEVDMTGGAGQYSSYVFKIIEDEICALFSSPTDNVFDTGYFGNLKEGYKLEIKNQYTGYMSTLDFSNCQDYLGYYFDKSGNIIHEERVSGDSFYEFKPEDCDGNGVFDIVCSQYFSIGGRTNYIGDAKSVLGFNLQTQEFEVIQAVFIPVYCP